MYPFCLREVKGYFALDSIMRFGGLPIVLRQLELAEETLASYVNTYLKEEIKEEALVRRLDDFSRFLMIAGQLNGSLLNLENIARESSKSAKTIANWYQILEETLLVSKIEAYRPGFKVRESAHPKYYWFDHAVARMASGLTWEDIDNTIKGFEFECLLLREIQVYMEVSRRFKRIFYYNTPGAGEIDFVIETRPKTINQKPNFITIEVKYSKKWKRDFEAPSRSLRNFAKESHQRMLGVYLGEDRLTFDEFEVMPVHTFVEELFSGRIF